MNSRKPLGSVIVSWGLLLAAILITYLHGQLIFDADLFVSPPVFYGGILLFVLVSWVTFRHLRTMQADTRTIETQRSVLELQKSVLAVMRDQRHDMLNNLASASAYLQLGKYEQVAECLDFMAADLSDRFNHGSLPTDAWGTVIEQKRLEAESCGIVFHAFLQEPPPTDLQEQRLLPRLTANLIDNAIAAVLNVESPQVSLEWGVEGNHRVLAVSNNGPPIPPEIQKAIVNDSIAGHQQGWGLPIARRIAMELGGALQFTSCDSGTRFWLEMPIKNKS